MVHLDLTQGKLFPTWTMSMPQTLVFRFGAETSGMISNMRSLVTDPATKAEENRSINKSRKKELNSKLIIVRGFEKKILSNQSESIMNLNFLS